MKLCDFLILLLQAHAQVLLRLAALFGEDALIEMLELKGDRKRSEEPALDPKWILSPRGTPAGTPEAAAGSSPYRALEGSVHEIGLPAILEFHLWAYPFYRTLIEADLGLETLLAGPSSNSAGSPAQIPIIDAAIAESEKWIHSLPIPPALSLRAEQAARKPWMHFRTEAFRRMGHRPIGVVPS